MKHLGVFDSHNVIRHMRHEPEPPVSFAKSVIAGVVMAIFVLAIVFLCMGRAHAASIGEENCSILGKTAGMLMKARQTGVPLQQSLDAFNSVSMKGVTPQFVEAIKGLVVIAYRTPRYELPENQADAILDFQDRVQASCMMQVLAQ